MRVKESTHCTLPQKRVLPLGSLIPDLSGFLRFAWVVSQQLFFSTCSGAKFGQNSQTLTFLKCLGTLLNSTVTTHDADDLNLRNFCPVKALWIIFKNFFFNVYFSCNSKSTLDPNCSITSKDNHNGLPQKSPNSYFFNPSNDAAKFRRSNGLVGLRNSLLPTLLDIKATALISEPITAARVSHTRAPIYPLANWQARPLKGFSSKLLCPHKSPN